MLKMNIIINKIKKGLKNFIKTFKFKINIKINLL